MDLAGSAKIKSVPKHKSYFPIQSGSFFAYSNITISISGCISFTCGLRSKNLQAHQQTGLSDTAVLTAFAGLREIYARYLQRHPIRLGGPGTVVQIDESCFSHKPKHHRV